MALAPHWLDELFASPQDGGPAVIEAIASNPNFVAAVNAGLGAELTQQASQVGQRPHPGPGPGQSGRGAFLQAIEALKGGNAMT